MTRGSWLRGLRCMQWRRAALSPLVLLLLTSGAVAQRGSGKSGASSNPVDIRVRVTYENDRPVPAMIRVELMSQSNIPIQQMFTDSEGQTGFLVGGDTTYHVRVSGPNIQETVSESIAVNATDRSRLLYVRVKPRADDNPEYKSGAGAMTSAAALRIPADARKSFDSGSEAWQKNDYAKAAEYYQKAIDSYPQYDAAYNNLGVAFIKLNQPDRAWDAFEQAVQLNDKNADAERNFARLLLRKGQYSKAEDLLNKSLVVEPSDPSGLTLVALAELEAGEYDAALRNAQKVHRLPHQNYVVCHYIAGEALERKQQLSDARAEYQLYLQELPDGPEAGAVRAALARIDDMTANAQ